MRHEEGFADVNGARLYYQVAGEGFPVVLLHAGVADHTMYDAQFELFAEKYCVVRFDLRGFGQSSMPPSPYQLHEDLEGLMQFLSIDKAYLIGTSMGGGVIIDYTLAYPDKVAAIIPTAAAISGVEAPAEMLPKFDKLIALYQQRDINGAVEEHMQIWLAGFDRSLDDIAPELKEHFRRMELNNLAREFADGIEREAPGLNAKDRLGEIHVPTLFIAGDADNESVLANSDLVAQNVSGAEKVILHNVAHLPPMEAPAEFNQLALDFLAKCDAARNA